MADPKETPEITIIIPTKDRVEVFNQSYLQLVEAIQGFDFEIIVVNDSKTNELNLPKPYAHARVVKNKASGVASARNAGAALARGRWLLFMDDDMLISRENIEAYLKYTRHDKKVAVNLEWVYPPDVTERIRQTAFGRFLIRYGFTTMRGWNNDPDWPQNSSVPVDFITSPNLLIRKDHFLSTGGYDEKFPFAGAEDYAYSEILKREGFELIVDTNSIMYHNEKDRLNPKEWFERKVRNGKTRRVAAEGGFPEQAINHSFLKRVFYFFTPVAEPLVKFLLYLSSGSRFADPVSFRCYKMLLGISLYKGYRMHD